MNKQTFTIPEGCTEISVEQDGDKLIATFGKSSKFEPKQGDVCFGVSANHDMSVIFIFDQIDPHSNIYYFAAKSSNSSSVWINDWIDNEFIQRLATPEESKKFFDDLEKEGLQWDAENKKLVKIRWRPGDGEEYYYFDGDEVVKTCWGDCDYEKRRLSIGNVFKTEADCLAALDLLKQALINFHNEN